MRFLYNIIAAYDLIGGSTSKGSPHTDVGVLVATTILYESLMTFVMVCSSMQPYIVCLGNISHS